MNSIMNNADITDENIPKLIIFCVTYNHEKYIRECLEGFVMQKTNFPFQAYVADDCSTDGTVKIVLEYAQKYPDIIVPIIRESNLGGRENWLRLQESVKSQYVALCEGDDYWTDENKLQMQVDYLDSHPGISMCFHTTKMIWEDGSIPDRVMPTREMTRGKDVLVLSDIVERNIIMTCSAVYRWRFRDENLRQLCTEASQPSDWFLHLLHAQKGDIGYLPCLMSVYRRHAGGIDYGNSYTNLTATTYALGMYSYINKTYVVDKDKYRKDILLPFARRALIENAWEKKYKALDDIITACPDAEFLAQFCSLYKKCYIYGAGDIARKLAALMDWQGLEYSGFIVSDGHINPGIFCGQRCYYLSQIGKDETTGIILALNKKNTAQAERTLKEVGITNYLKIDFEMCFSNECFRF